MIRLVAKDQEPPTRKITNEGPIPTKEKKEKMDIDVTSKRKRNYRTIKGGCSLGWVGKNPGNVELRKK